MNLQEAKDLIVVYTKKQKENMDENIEIYAALKKLDQFVAMHSVDQKAIDDKAAEAVAQIEKADAVKKPKMSEVPNEEPKP
jgi:hypothetical protein